MDNSIFSEPQNLHFTSFSKKIRGFFPPFCRIAWPPFIFWLLLHCLHLKPRFKQKTPIYQTNPFLKITMTSNSPKKHPIHAHGGQEDGCTASRSRGRGYCLFESKPYNNLPKKAFNYIKYATRNSSIKGKAKRQIMKTKAYI